MMREKNSLFGMAQHLKAGQASHAATLQCLPFTSRGAQACKVLVLSVLRFDSLPHVVPNPIG